MARLWKLATVADDDVLLWFPTLSALAFDGLDDVHAFDDSTENNVTVVQPGSFHGCNEELGTVCVWSSVGLLCEETNWLVKLENGNEDEANLKAELTIDNVPGPTCFKVKFSSSNLLP